MSNRKIIRVINILKKIEYITSKQVTAKGIERNVLKTLVDMGELYRVSRGVYARSDTWEDELYLLQNKYKKGIYSHDTALYLLGYSDRTPAKYIMTFPQGYNSPSLKQECVVVKRALMDYYSFGIIELSSPCGNTIHLYNLERTLCDILRGRGSDIQIIIPAMRRYISSQAKDINKLMQYAEQLHVRSKVLRYLEVLL